MASSGGSTGAAYQVFLSFRGPDTRQGLADVLYHALTDAGIRVFRDNEEIRNGEDIGEEILRAIKDSSIFVPIFSRGYASSRWCLLELSEMVESKKGSSGKKILPVFYDVRVDDVKLKTELYSEALNKHSDMFGPETVQQWEEALRKAGKIKGWELKDTGHAEFAKKVVREISMKLKVKHKLVTEYFVQRNDQMEALMKLLDIQSSDTRFVGIYGMGGIGKTTLAKVVFNQLCHRFDFCSFLCDVRESSRHHKGIEQLQKQLLGCLGLGSGEVMNVDDGIIRMRRTLVQKKVLIVIDDVDHRKQIESLAGDSSWFGCGSRIIVTTRDRGVLELERQRIQTLEVEEMKPEEARQLLCMHAFQKDTPPDDYLSLSEEVVASSGRLPLALEVIGSHLWNKSYKEWVGTIKRLKKVLHRDVQEKLMISYEALSPTARQIFLDIACFFIDEEKTYPVYMWEACDFDPEVKLKELINMSLVKIIVEEDIHRKGIKKKKFWIHDQLRDLGRKIVHDERFQDLIKRGRLWIPEDALQMLLEEEGKENIEMLRLHYDRFAARSAEGYTFTQRELSSLGKLRYLECSGANFSGELKHLLPKLRWLSWHFCPATFMATELRLRNLVILDLSWSWISECWSGWSQIEIGTTLKVLNLSQCHNLRMTPDLSIYPCLERLILAGCINLVKIHPSVGKLKFLKFLDVSNCYYLKDFPEVVQIGKPPQSDYGLANLCHVSLYGCYALQLPVSIGKLRSLIRLDLSESGIRLPRTIGDLQKLRVIKMRGSDISKLPTSIGKLKALEELDASYSRLEGIPSTVEGLTGLRVLNLESTCVSVLPRKLPTGLTDLLISSSSLKIVPDFSYLHNLVRLILLDNADLSGPGNIGPLELQGIGNLCRLVELRLKLRVTSIPDKCSSLSQLQHLTLECPNLRYLPTFPSSLTTLVLRVPSRKAKLSTSSEAASLALEGFDGIIISRREYFYHLDLTRADLDHLYSVYPEIPRARAGLSHLENLKLLTIDGAEKLIRIWELGSLRSLEELTITDCNCLVRLPDLSNLESLRRITIHHCKMFKGIDDISKLKSLEFLSVKGCDCEDVVIRLAGKIHEESRKRRFKDLD